MTSVVVPLGIGVAFGWTLERAGLGSATKLAGQFYLRDLTVFKVMFSAIVTAMLGVFWLSRLGVIDPASIYVPDTFLAPQLVGGIVFGVGFIVAGLCPGTSCVSAATGRGDGLAAVVGMFTGVLATGLALPSMAAFYTSTSRGPLTLPDALHRPYGVVAFAVVAVALCGFALAQHLERRRFGHERWLGAIALTLGVSAAAFGPPAAPRSIAAIDLADWLRAGRDQLRVIDIRSPEAFDAYHVPRAENVPLDALAAATFARTDTIVVYSDAGAHEAEAFRTLQSRGLTDIYALRGGAAAWLEDVMNPSIAADASAEERDAFQHTAELSRFFGGSPRVGAPSAGASPADVVARMKRRGC